MIAIPKTDTLSAKTDYLMCKKFSPQSLAAIKRVDLLGFQGEEAPEIQKIRQETEAYREKLASMSEEEIEQLYLKQQAAEEQSYFFNQPDANADFDYWSKMPEWKLEEAIILSFGKSPEIVTWPRIKSALPPTSPFIQKLLKFRELAVRAKKANHFTDARIPGLNDPILPYKFVNWMQANELDFPQELAERVLRIYEANKPPKTPLERSLEQLEEFSNDPALLKRPLKKQAQNTQRPKSKTAHTKEKATLLKMIIGMAIGGYGYDPSELKSPIPKEISEDLLSNGISVSDDTVRKWLKEAAESNLDDISKAL